MRWLHKKQNKKEIESQFSTNKISNDKTKKKNKKEKKQLRSIRTSKSNLWHSHEIKITPWKANGIKQCKKNILKWYQHFKEAIKHEIREINLFEFDKLD
jgi:hypothetical protein